MQAEQTMRERAAELSARNELHERQAAESREEIARISAALEESRIRESLGGGTSSAAAPPG